MFFDHLNERNAMVKSVQHFDNFTKWTILVVNICPLFLGEWYINLKTLNQTKQSQAATIHISSAAQRLRAMYTSAIFILRAIYVWAIAWRALRLLAKHLESTFSNTSRWLILWDVHLALSLADRNYRIWLWSLCKDPSNLVTACQSYCSWIQLVVWFSTPILPLRRICSWLSCCMLWPLEFYLSLFPWELLISHQSPHQIMIHNN